MHHQFTQKKIRGEEREQGMNLGNEWMYGRLVKHF